MKRLSLQLSMLAPQTTVHDAGESPNFMNAILWFANNPTHQIRDDDEAEASCVVA